ASECPTSSPHRAPSHVPGVLGGGVRSPGGGARCAAWFRYASPPINAATITSATSTSRRVTSVVTLGAPILPGDRRAQRRGNRSGAGDRGQHEVAVDRAREPGDGQRLPPRLQGSDAPHHARVAERLAEQLDVERSHAAAINGDVARRLELHGPHGRLAEE